jgi:hypothetical protein
MFPLIPDEMENRVKFQLPFFIEVFNIHRRLMSVKDTLPLLGFYVAGFKNATPIFSLKLMPKPQALMPGPSK